MMPRVGKRRGGAPMATRTERDRELETPTDAASAGTASREPMDNGRATTAPGTLEDRR